MAPLRRRMRGDEPIELFLCQNRVGEAHFSIPDHHGVWLGTLFVRHRLEDAIREWLPRLILPLDDISAWLLRSLAVDTMVSPALRYLLVESLGAPEGYSAAVSRQAFMDAAAQLDVNKPEHREDLMSRRHLPRQTRGDTRSL